MTIKWLEDVGISPEVISLSGIEATYNGIKYPVQYPPRIDVETDNIVYDTVYRTRLSPEYHAEENRKRAEKGDKPLGKTFNPTRASLPPEQNGEQPVLYIWNFRALQKAVKANGGILYLVEGDKDVWSMHSIGIDNCAGIISTGAKIGKFLMRILEALGVSHVRFIPDVDEAGWGLAQKLSDILTADGYSFSIYHLGTYHPLTIGTDDVQTIKDINDLLVGYGNYEDTYEYVIGLRKMELASQKQRDYAEKGDYFTQDLYDLIESKLGIEKYRDDRKEMSEHVACPVKSHTEDDRDPKFAWDKKRKIGSCMKCGKTYLTVEVCDGLGINWKSYVNKGKERQRPPSIKTPDTAIVAVGTENIDLLSSNSTMLQMPGSFIEKIGPRLEMLRRAPDESLVHFFDDALDTYELRLKGAVPAPYPSIKNPIKMLHKIGGAGKAIPRPFMVGLLGMSGGFKTTLLTWVVNQLSFEGYNVIVWTPEWDTKSNADRIVQQFGGLRMDEMNIFERYYAERQMIEDGTLDSDDPALFGEVPDTERLIDTEVAIHNIRKSFRGKIGYLRTFNADPYDLVAQLFRVYEIMTASNNQPHVFILDYAQMVDAPEDSYRWRTQDTIRIVKQATFKLGLVTYMSSQVRKDDTEKVLGAGKILTGTSGLDFHDQKFNLFLTATPRGITVMPDGRRLQEVKLAVTKNSIGGKADTEETAPSFYVDLDRMLVLEHPNDTTPVMSVSMADPDHSANQHRTFGDNPMGYANVVSAQEYEEPDYDFPDDIGFIPFD